MSLAHDFARAVGGALAHVTAASNLALIERGGLKSAHGLAQDAGVDTASLALRPDRVRVGNALLNHQKPFLLGLDAARNVLDGHSPESWASQLDRRVFFWPERLRTDFEASIDIDVPVAVIKLDALKFAEAFSDEIYLCALNSGSFRQISADPAKKTGVRGDWIYRPLSQGIDAFRRYRRDNGLVKGLDRVKEVSLRCSIPPGTLASLRLDR